MSKSDSNAAASRGKTQKPNKPYPDFPLFPHAAGAWAKKIRGKLHYFGPWADSNVALKKYLAEKDARHAGRKPRENSARLTAKDVCNDFPNVKQTRVDSEELARRSWRDYKDACELVIEKFGKGREPVALGNVIQRIRVVFKFAFDNGSIDRSVRYGQNFARPSRKTVRRDRAKKGPKLFTADEARAHPRTRPTWAPRPPRHQPDTVTATGRTPDLPVTNGPSERATPVPPSVWGPSASKTLPSTS
jgi:hypothetical protein